MVFAGVFIGGKEPTHGSRLMQRVQLLGEPVHRRHADVAKRITLVGNVSLVCSMVWLVASLACACVAGYVLAPDLVCAGFCACSVICMYAGLVCVFVQFWEANKQCAREHDMVVVGFHRPRFGPRLHHPSPLCYATCTSGFVLFVRVAAFLCGDSVASNSIEGALLSGLVATVLEACVYGYISCTGVDISVV